MTHQGTKGMDKIPRQKHQALQRVQEHPAVLHEAPAPVGRPPRSGDELQQERHVHLHRRQPAHLQALQAHRPQSLCGAQLPRSP